MNKTKKILIISPFARPNIGGVETHLDKLTSYLGKHNHYSIILTYQPLSTDARGQVLEKSENFEIHRVSWFGVGWFDKLEKSFPLVFLYLFPGLFFKSLIYYLKHHQEIDCIHAHGLVAATIVCLIKLIHHKRTVVSTHAVYVFSKRHNILGKTVKKILNTFDKIIAVSEVSRDELIDLGISKEKIVCFVNWVDTDVFKPHVLDTTFEQSVKKINFLFLSRLVEKKGLLLYLKAAERIKEADFYVVGSGQLEKEVVQAAKNQSNIKFIGTLNPNVPQELKTMVDLYNLADYFISPYLYDEGYSSTLLEAVCCGTRVVIPRRGSPPLFLAEQVVEYMPEFISEEILIDKLSDLLKKPKNENSIKTCREFGESKLGFSNARIILDAYEG